MPNVPEGTDFVDDGPTHGAAMSNSLADSRPAERLAIEAIAWLTTAGTAAGPVRRLVPLGWLDVLARRAGRRPKVKNLRANPKVALHLSDDGNGGDVVTVEGTAELRDGWSDSVESAYLAKYDEAIRTALRHQFRATADRLPGSHSHPPESHEDLVSVPPAVP